MNASGFDITELLEGYSTLALEYGTDLYWSRMPPKPQDCVTVFDVPGSSPMLQYSKANSNYHYPKISVQVRNTDYKTGYDLMLAIMEFLHGTAHTVINDTYYSLIKAEADPALLHYDENNRSVFYVNFEIQRRINI